MTPSMLLSDAIITMFIGNFLILEDSSRVYWLKYRIVINNYLDRNSLSIIVMGQCAGASSKKNQPL